MVEYAAHGCSCLIELNALAMRVRNPGSRVGERKHVRRHDDRVPPRIGLAFDRGKGREALRRKYVPSQQGERRRQTP